ncbi:murein biosynthesis integral membrane protein MurJ [Patulibacter minatonensis]|uniref:murein biosynthesis integral membrane protein MurJ n=1 Tax=Patulibacter minatonensis TaxID=298163 RepID=UPI00047A5CB1|nr:murein biosynthesis integral membrane protein MurJ [Patulibacter minatonensis]
MPASRPRPHAAVPGDPDPEGGGAEGVIPESGSASGRARNTIIFSVATGLSRVAGLIREIFSNALYGAGGAASAFTIAFAVPNLLRALFADMALSAAFVPVFTELLEKKKKREALLLLSTLFWVLLAGLALLVGVAMLTAPLYMPLFVGDEVTRDLGSGGNGLTVGLSQVMLPTVLLLGLNGLFVGALNAYDHFTIPALSPLVWNFVIIVVNLALLPAFGGADSAHGIYAQAVGILVGTGAQLMMAVPVLRRYGIRLVPKVNIHDPRLRQVLVLMVPVAISLGLINFSALIDSILASHVSDDGPRAIEAAFRLYMLPQGIFSVAIVTVLFPVLSRAVARRDDAQLRGLLGNGMAQILVLLVPIGLLFASPVISHDIIETLFQRGKWTDANTDTATTALVWLGISLALNGVSLLLSRTFFALQRPWANTGLAMGSLVANVAVSVALYRPLGIAGIVIGTFVGNVVLVGLQIRLLRKETGGPLGLLPVLRSLLQVLVASVLAVLAATGVVLIGQIATDALADGAASSIVTMVYLGIGIVAGGVVYVGLARDLGLRELEQAGARFVRLWARVQGPLLRLPGVRTLVAASGSSVARTTGDAVGTVLRILAWPLRLPTALAVALSRLLVGMVPAGPAVAVAGPAVGGPGRAGAARAGGRSGGATRGRSGGAAGGRTGAVGPGGAGAPRVDAGRPHDSGATPSDAGRPGPDPSAGSAGPGGAPTSPGVVGPRGRGAGRRRPDAGAPAPFDPADPATRSGGTEVSRRLIHPAAPVDPGTPSPGAPRVGEPVPGAPTGASGPGAPPADPGAPAPDLYDAARDWPTIGQRGGETLDVPWPGVEQHGTADPYSEPAWEDEVGASRLEAYGVERPEGGLTPEQQRRAAQRAEARRMIEAREEALERIAERARRRREGGGSGPRRGKRKRRD